MAEVPSTLLGMSGGRSVRDQSTEPQAGQRKQDQWTFKYEDSHKNTNVHPCFWSTALTSWSRNNSITTPQPQLSVKHRVTRISLSDKLRYIFLVHVKSIHSKYVPVYWL
jgi:hypothetical protein